MNILPLATYADLRALDASSTAEVAFVTGTAARGDGGGGIFMRDDTATVDDNGVDIIDAAGRGWRRDLADKINAEWYGVRATCADNRVQLQAAIDKAFATGVRRVFLRAGAFQMSGPVDLSGVALEGSGPIKATSLVLIEPNQGLVTFNGHRDGVHTPGGRLANMGLFVAAGITGGIAIKLGSGTVNLPDRVQLEQLRITTNSSAQPGLWKQAIVASGISRASPPGIRGLTVKDVEVFNCTSPALVFSGITNLRGEGINTFTGQGVQSMMGIWVGGNGTVKSVDAQLSDCRADGPINVTNTIESGFEGRFYGGAQTDPATTSGLVFSVD